MTFGGEGEVDTGGRWREFFACLVTNAGNHHTSVMNLGHEASSPATLQDISYDTFH